MPLRRFQTAFLSTESRCSNTHESTLQKTNDTSSSGAPRVYRAWGQTQFKRSPARSWQHKIKETLQVDALLAIISFQGQSLLLLLKIYRLFCQKAEKI